MTYSQQPVRLNSEAQDEQKLKRNITAVIDPGHGGSDPGAYYQGRREADDNLRLSLKIAERLIPMGIKPVLTRKSNTYITLQQRVLIGELNHADQYISIHRNAFSPEKARGFEVYTQSKATPGDKLLAQAIYKNVVLAGVSAERGVKAYDFYVCRCPNMPSCLVEMLFCDNTIDNMLFDAQIDLYALAIANGIFSAAQQPEQA